MRESLQLPPLLWGQLRSEPVILIASITSKKTGRVYPFEVLVEPPEGGLRERSKIVLMHPRSVDQ
jgi:mRNA-degrading endonuclease toxin of MazEF toxin-antitoxin module